MRQLRHANKPWLICYRVQYSSFKSYGRIKPSSLDSLSRSRSVYESWSLSSYNGTDGLVGGVSWLLSPKGVRGYLGGRSIEREDEIAGV